MAIRTRQAKNKRDSNGVLTGRPGTVYDVDIKYTAPDGAKKSYTKRGFATKREAAQHRANQIRSFCVEPCGGCAMTHSRRDFPAPDCRAINTDSGKQAQQLVGDEAQNT